MTPLVKTTSRALALGTTGALVAGLIAAAPANAAVNVDVPPTKTVSGELSGPIGIEDDAGTLLAFGSFGTFRAFPAYKYTVEHSVYVHPDHRGRGLGLQVMRALIDAARARQLHALVGAIDASNAGSIALHQRLGFQHVGTLPQVGFKFGRWLDLAFWQLTLDTPAAPVDG